MDSLNVFKNFKRSIQTLLKKKTPDNLSYTCRFLLDIVARVVGYVVTVMYVVGYLVFAEYLQYCYFQHSFTLRSTGF